MCHASRVLAVTALCLIASAGLATAQQQTSVNGGVIDASGLGLPGATVTVTSQTTGFVRTVVTADTGGYTVSNLEPGAYGILIELPGFRSVRRPDVPVSYTHLTLPTICSV